MQQKMRAKAQRTYDMLFQHPITHNLEWRDVKSLFEEVGEFEQQHNGNVKLTVMGQMAVVQSPSLTSNATAADVEKLRHMFETANCTSDLSSEVHVLVVVDHKEAKIFHLEVKDSTPTKIVPYDPFGHRNHVHSPHDYAGNSEHPDHSGYYEKISESLDTASNILIFGAGHGSSSAKDEFIEWLKKHKPTLAQKVIGQEVVDSSHLTDAHLLAKAKELYRQQVLAGG